MSVDYKKTKYINEVLKEINEDPSLLTTTYRKVGNGGPLGKLFMHAFTVQGKFLLPSGRPPFRPSGNPQGMTPAIFQQEIHKFTVFCRTDITASKREIIFVQLLESIHPTEADILIAVKDQELTKLYPNITRKVVADAGFIPPLTEQEAAAEVAAVKKSSRPRGRPRKSETPQPAQ